MQLRIQNRSSFVLRRAYCLAGALFLCTGALVSAAPQYRSGAISVTVNGSPVAFEGMGPIQVDGRVLVPVRGVLESLGADVGWNEQSQTVVANNGRADIELRIGDHSASIDGQAVPLDVPAQVIAGHTMVPLRFLGQALGAEVHWNERARLVEIVTNRKDMKVRSHRSGQPRGNRPDRGNDNQRRNDNRDQNNDGDRNDRNQ